MQQRKSTSKVNFKLPGWTVGEPFKATTKVSGQTIFVTGIEAVHPVLGPVVGSAGSIHSFPMAQAWFELIERTAILDNIQRPTFDCLDATKGRFIKQMGGSQVFPQIAAEARLEYQYAKSNGVALHDCWGEACKRACFELIERHLILKSWTGESAPKLSPSALLHDSFKKLESLYTVVAIDFGSQAVSSFRKLIHVSGVALLPKDNAHPLILGFGAGFSSKEALQKAEAETWQRLGFLWGEDLPNSEPIFAASPLYHQDYYLYPGHHSVLHEWLDGKFYHQNCSNGPSIIRVDFASMHSLSRPEYFVSKAVASDTIPLIFGRGRLGRFSNMADDRLIHPIA